MLEPLLISRPSVSGSSSPGSSSVELIIGSPSSASSSRGTLIRHADADRAALRVLQAPRRLRVAGSRKVYGPGVRP